MRIFWVQVRQCHYGRTFIRLLVQLTRDSSPEDAAKTVGKMVDKYGKSLAGLGVGQEFSVEGYVKARTRSVFRMFVQVLSNIIVMKKGVSCDDCEKY